MNKVREGLGMRSRGVNVDVKWIKDGVLEVDPKQVLHLADYKELENGGVEGGTLAL